MTTQKELILTNMKVIHADKDFGEVLNDDKKKFVVERYVQFSFDEVEVLEICKWLDVWFSNITDRKVNQINFLEYIEKGKKSLEIVLNYNDYTFFSEIIDYNDEIINKIRKIVNI